MDRRTQDDRRDASRRGESERGGEPVARARGPGAHSMTTEGESSAAYLRLWAAPVAGVSRMVPNATTPAGIIFTLFRIMASTPWREGRALPLTLLDRRDIYIDAASRKMPA